MARKTWAQLEAQLPDNADGLIDAVDVREAVVDSQRPHIEAAPPTSAANQSLGFDVGHTWIDTSASPMPLAYRCVYSDNSTALWALIEGAPGTPGTPGTNGTSFTPEGAWDAGTTYTAGAVVRHDSATWAAAAETTGDEPGVEPVWVLLVEDGAQGPPGGGATVFTDLLDVPSSYTGLGGKFLAITVAEDGVEAVDGASGGNTVMYANHGANASFADPNPTGLTVWRGSVAPNNRKLGDLWIQTGAFD